MARTKAEEIKKFFDGFDKDASGFLDREEMKEVLQTGIQQGLIAPETQLDDFMRIADRDGDGEIGLIEFAEVIGFKKEIQHYRNFFQKVDTDGSGLVDERELEVILQEAGAENPKNEVEKLMRKALKRKGEVLNFDEFVALMLFNSPLRKRKGLVKSEPLSDEVIEELKRAFDKYDTDKSGYIDQKELRLFLKAEQGVDRSPQELDAIMKRVDTNGDGKLSLPEFIEMMGFKGEVQLYWEAFVRADTNENGRIDREELAAILKGLGVKKPKTEAKKILRGYDQKSLDFDQFVYVMLSY